MNEYVLGISDDYIANVALLAGGKPVFAAANERYSRKKGDAGFPQEALDAALAFAGISLKDIGRVVIANRTHFVYRLMKQHFRDYTHDFFNLKQKIYLKYHDLIKDLPPLAWGIATFNKHLMRSRIEIPITICDHHMAHACSSIATSGFDECLSVTIDNLGDGYSAKVYSYRQGRLEFLYGSSASNSPGQFYGEISQILGFNPLRHAGKVTGLAARGDPGPAYPIMEKLFGLSEDKRDFYMLSSLQRWKRWGPYWRLGMFSAEDVAAAAQKRLEDVVLQYVLHALKVSGHDKLVLAGGVLSNVKLNLVLWQRPEVRAMHVHPAMSDEGLALGAVIWWQMQNGHLTPSTLGSVYLGSQYSESEIHRALQAGNLELARPTFLAQTVAGLVARGHVVGRFDGRFEYGPRALGNRSILYRPDDPSVNDWLNHKLQRTEFMPFAPVTLWEDAEDCYQEIAGVKDTARFMTMAFNCTPEFKASCTGVVHLDGTARPQLIRQEDNPDYYAIMKEYKRLSGLPCMINTSFNMHEEPIVCTPKNAVLAYKTAQLDFLAIGNWIAWSPQRPDLRKSIEDVCSGNQ